MRQHNKVNAGTTKNRRRNVWTRGKEILANMPLESPVTKRKVRFAFVEARKQARKEMRDK